MPTYLNDNYATTTRNGDQFEGGDWDSLTHDLLTESEIAFQTDVYYSAGRAVKFEGQGGSPSICCQIKNRTETEFWERIRIYVPESFSLTPPNGGTGYCTFIDIFSEWIELGTFLHFQMWIKYNMDVILERRKLIGGEIVEKTQWNLGTLTKDQWNTFKIYVKRDNTNGIVKVKWDNILVKEFFGSTRWQQDGFNVNLHRLYNSGDESGTRILYFDDPYYGDSEPEEGGTTIYRQVSASVDDAWREKSTDTGGSTDADQIIAHSYTIITDYRYRNAGIKFNNITIPKDATILSAKIEINVAYAEYQDINHVIYGNLIANALDFVTDTQIYQRARTTANVSWVQDSLGTGWKEKTGLASIIQEIVNQASWVSGNSLALLFIGNTDVEKECRLFSWDYSDHSYGAKLEITYQTASESIVGVLVQFI